MRLPLSLLLSAWTAAAQAAPVRIGAAGGVSGTVLAFAPETSASRRMSSGKLVYHMDKVTTDSAGRMQVLLQDETVFTIGPDTELTLDEFVYDPKTGDGKVSAKITKGVFRFVTGKIAKKKPEKMKVKLPVGTIGIRGTIVAGKTDGNSATVALLGPGPANNAGERTGAASVQNAGVTVELVSAGFGTVIPGPGQPPSPPFKLSPEQLSQLDPTPKAEPGAGEGGPAGKSAGTPTEESGQQTAGAGGDLTRTDSTGQLAKTFNDLGNEAARDAAEGGAVLDGASTWDQLRTLQTGSGFYSMSGGYTCGGSGACSGGGSGTFSAFVDVNFDNKQITSVSFSLSGTLSDSTSLANALPFGTTGTATQVFTAGQLTNSAFQNTQVTFLNSGGVAGAQMRLDSLCYFNGSDSLDNGATAVGNLQTSGGG